MNDNEFFAFTKRYNFEKILGDAEAFLTKLQPESRADLLYTDNRGEIWPIPLPFENCANRISCPRTAITEYFTKSSLRKEFAEIWKMIDENKNSHFSVVEVDGQTRLNVDLTKGLRSVIGACHELGHVFFENRISLGGFSSYVFSEASAFLCEEFSSIKILEELNAIDFKCTERLKLKNFFKASQMISAYSGFLRLRNFISQSIFSFTPFETKILKLRPASRYSTFGELVYLSAVLILEQRNESYESSNCDWLTEIGNFEERRIFENVSKQFS